MMASLTKLPAAIAILQAVEKGLLTLDEDLRPRLKALAETQILRGFDDTTGQPIYEANPAPVTLRILLTHTGGFVYDLTEPSIMRWRKVTGNTKVHNSWTKKALRTPMLFEPGTAWNYGTNIEWAALALEQATGQGLHAYMAENIFKPLGMGNSSIGPANAAKSTEELRTHLAGCPARTADGTLEPAELPNPVENYDLESGGAGLLSTAKDYSKLLQAVLRGELLQAESLELLFMPQLEGDVLADMRRKLALHRPALAPEYTDDTPTNFAFGGMLNLEDVPGMRPKGSMMWSGFLNSHWVKLLHSSARSSSVEQHLTKFTAQSSGSTPRTISQPFSKLVFSLLPTRLQSNCTMSLSVRSTGSSSVEVKTRNL